MTSSAVGRGGKSAAAATPRLSFVLAALVASLPWASPPAAAQTTRTVSNANELDNAWRSAQPGDTIELRPGTYNLVFPVILRQPGLTLRGSTGDADDVILVGGGMNTRGIDEGVIVEADDVTVQDITISEFYYNGIHVRAESDADRTWIHDVKTLNIGERHIKGSRIADPAKVSDDLVIERVRMTQNKPRQGHADTSPNYIGGIDMMALRNPIIRDTLAEGIVGSQQGGNAAIFLWNGIQNALIERNVIVGCAKGIALGNPYLPDDPTMLTYPWHAAGGLIRNNFILRGVWTTGNNISIELANTRDVKVFHNTIYSENASYFRAVSISDSEPSRGTTSNVSLAHNIVRGGFFTSTFSGGWSSTGDIFDNTGTTVTPAWFANPSVADFHLTANAAAAIDRAAALAEVTEDIDGTLRPRGAAPDIGADEFEASGPAAPTRLYTVPPCRIFDTRNPAGPWGGPALAAGVSRNFSISGRCGVPPTAKAVSVNLTVTQPSAAGNLRLYPGGSAVPLSSSINYSAGQTRANNAIAALGPGGILSIRSVQPSGTVQLILDVNGYFE